MLANETADPRSVTAGRLEAACGRKTQSKGCGNDLDFVTGLSITGHDSLKKEHFDQSESCGHGTFTQDHLRNITEGKTIKSLKSSGFGGQSYNERYESTASEISFGSNRTNKTSGQSPRNPYGFDEDVMTDNMSTEVRNNERESRGKHLAKIERAYIPHKKNVKDLFNDCLPKGEKFMEFYNDEVSLTVQGRSSKSQENGIKFFEELNFPSQLMRNVRNAGYTIPTPIQQHVIPRILEGKQRMFYDIMIHFEALVSSCAEVVHLLALRSATTTMYLTGDLRISKNTQVMVIQHPMATSTRLVLKRSIL
ncbi:hypothetical protein DICVIV_09314 [Dictyocaulus viviparus]|uniref:RNA helicase n=1 Tax=Dictyocaulus viviparus TaxID=29172 RepID=A0A0D8XLM6_DICVI|nr:hypothetical protein DICVIV_09314 [Dictyocaulus viviparus]